MKKDLQLKRIIDFEFRTNSISNTTKSTSKSTRTGPVIDVVMNMGANLPNVVDKKKLYDKYHANTCYISISYRKLPFC